ncbi:MAG: cytochrome c biogenesis protein CcsA, partial [Alloprevotella sp.]|nr:cytochrome c biogenesis protein CcsA [Alloprevotella sp.]
LLLLYLLCGYALRWYIGGRIPLSNGSETMQFLALCALSAGILRRTGDITPALPPLVGGFALLVSWLGERSPQVTSLVPVLNSPLLSLHVSVIMVAYALLTLSAAGSLAALFRPSLRQPLLERGTRLLRPAVFLLAAGIFLGAVWANVSWGSYWSWDPKETWALITLMVYAVPLHTASLSALRRPLVYHCYQLFAFLSLLMTYFGVNYFLGGMHSYA